VNNRISGYHWSAGTLEWQRNLPVQERCSPFIPTTESSEQSFRQWMKREKPDSLLAYKLPVRNWLSRMGLSVPNDIGVAYLFRSQEEMKQSAGIDGNLFMVGSAALDLVVGGLVTNQVGLPEHPKTNLSSIINLLSYLSILVSSKKLMYIHHI